MNTEVGARITLKNVLFLTDFSEASEAALPFALAIAREYGATVHALHVLTPTSYLYTVPDPTLEIIEAQERSVRAKMQRVEAQLYGLPHEAMIERGIAVWPTIERALKDHDIDLIILGTHGRTGAKKLLLGSVAEEIFRRSNVPVFTIGPGVRSGTSNGARFQCVLFATDFTPESLAATPYAVSLAQENQALLLLMHVIQVREQRKEQALIESSAAEVFHKLGELVSKDADLWCHPETIVDYGDPAEKILEVAKRRWADLIVLGVRDAASRLGAATHLERATAHKVVAHAACPILTFRG